MFAKRPRMLSSTGSVRRLAVAVSLVAMVLPGLAAANPMMVVDVGSLMGGNRSLSGVFLGAEIMTDRAHDMIQTLVEDYIAKRFGGRQPESVA